MKRLVVISILSLLLTSCIGGRAGALSEAESVDVIDYAKGFTISRHGEFTEVSVRDPWDTTRLLQRYLLVDRSLKELPEGMGVGTVVRTPLRKMVVYTSVHASIIELLGAEDLVAGLCEVQYIESDTLRARVERGVIADIGESTAPNIEKVMDIGCDAIITSPFKDAGYGPAEKLGIPLVEGADYMEQHPLGRVEWIKFYGMLVSKEELADSIYRATCKEYNTLKELAVDVENRPTMIAEKRYGGQWFVPAGDSCVGVLYNDAGADYIFKEGQGGGSIPLAFESVLDRGIHADIWLIKYYNSVDLRYKDLAEEYAPYANFDAFKNRKIFACNSFSSSYYEDSPMHPQLILKDLIWVFHPELLTNYTPKYFTPMLEE